MRTLLLYYYSSVVPTQKVSGVRLTVLYVEITLEGGHRTGERVVVIVVQASNSV